MKKSIKKTDKFTGITIGDEYNGPEKIELICNKCSRTLVKLSDGNGNHDLFCTYCSITYDMEDESVRHKQRLSVPEEIEPDITSVETVPDVSIRHEPELRGAIRCMCIQILEHNLYQNILLPLLSFQD
jgi:hypothetical protein